MHRAVHLSTAVFKRSLASSARTWTNESMAQLRQEAKARGLASTGTKATLVQRLTTFEEDPAAGRRAASTRVAPAAPSAVDVNIFNIKIPDLSEPPAQLEAQVPYVPDFWASPSEVVTEGSEPKLLVVAGAATHPGGGPSHNLILEAHEPGALEEEPKAPAATSSLSQNGGVFLDIAQDLGFLTHAPTAKPAGKPFWQLFS